MHARARARTSASHTLQQTRKETDTTHIIQELNHLGRFGHAGANPLFSRDLPYPILIHPPGMQQLHVVGQAPGVGWPPCAHMEGVSNGQSDT